MKLVVVTYAHSELHSDFNFNSSLMYKKISKKKHSLKLKKKKFEFFRIQGMIVIRYDILSPHIFYFNQD